MFWSINLTALNPQAAVTTETETVQRTVQTTVILPPPVVGQPKTSTFERYTTSAVCRVFHMTLAIWRATVFLLLNRADWTIER